MSAPDPLNEEFPGPPEYHGQPFACPRISRVTAVGQTPYSKQVARTTGFVVRVFSLTIVLGGSYSCAVSKLRGPFLPNRSYTQRKSADRNPGGLRYWLTLAGGHGSPEGAI